MRSSALKSRDKEHELRRLRRMTPEQRLKAQVKLNAQIRDLFIAGLRNQGFSGSEIARLWRGK